MIKNYSKENTNMGTAEEAAQILKSYKSNRIKLRKQAGDRKAIKTKDKDK